MRAALPCAHADRGPHGPHPTVNALASKGMPALVQLAGEHLACNVSLGLSLPAQGFPGSKTHSCNARKCSSLLLTC